MASLKLIKTGRFSVLALPSEDGEAPSVITSGETSTKGKANNVAADAGTNNKSKKSKKKQGGKKQPQSQQQQTKEPEREWTTQLQTDYDRIISIGEECISPTELKTLLLTKGRGSTSPTGFNLYDGFEPSGRMHIAQGIFKAMNVNKATYQGTNGTFVFWVADWFALMNDKMGGDLEKIKTVGKYLIEVWKAAGMDLTNVIFKWASEEITQNATMYWPLMLDVARRFNVTRIKKCCQIMGRLEGSLTAAQVLYPLMQCTDVFFLKADICQLGVDQRKVNMLAREYCDAAGRSKKGKPIILSHHMLYGLKAGQEKMSKSDPDSAVFMEDSAEDVERKIMAAYCPSKEEEGVDGKEEEDVDAGKESLHLTVDKLKNPCLDYIQHIILSPPNATFTAGGIEYKDFPSIRNAFVSGKLSEQQLKEGLISSLNELLEPVRTHFTTDETAKALLEQVRQYKKESLVKAVDTTETTNVRRLDLVGANMVKANSHVVFAPLPNSKPTLQEAIDTLSRLQHAKKQQGGTAQPVVLFLSDWTARVQNACNADTKIISAYYSILLTSLQSLDTTSIMDNVTVVLQSEAILTDPSNYWINVINVGRHFTLDDVMGPQMKDSDNVGIVIGRLMLIADVMGIDPGSIALSSASADQNDGATVECTLVKRFYQEKLDKSGMTCPEVVHDFGGVFIGLQERKEVDAHKTENDEYYLLDDPKVHGKSKMKKAFCEPGNIQFCPPIVLASTFAFGLDDNNDSSPGTGQKKKENGDILIQRSDENGGNVTYTSRSEMENDFQCGKLHPGDLKNAASTIMVEVLTKLSNDLKKDKETVNACKAMKAFEKKMSKKKK